MANKTLFKSLTGKFSPATDALNEERAPAYALSPKHQLAQYAATGCINRTFYASAEEQLAKVLELCADIDAEFIARTAVFCRERGFMKDMPALLCAVLSVKDRELLSRVFPRVIDNQKMLRNFVQIMRSGVVGRKSLGTVPKRLVREWLDARCHEAEPRGAKRVRDGNSGRRAAEGVRDDARGRPVVGDHCPQCVGELRGSAPRRGPKLPGADSP